MPETIQYMLYVNTRANAKKMLSLLIVGTQNSDVDVKIFSKVSTFIQTTEIHVNFRNQNYFISTFQAHVINVLSVLN